MTRCQADVATANASRYLQQLCKHWSHRFAVEFDASHGVVHLNGGVCTFNADAGRLRLALEGDDPEALPRLCDVVTTHLTRFAFREDLDVRWVNADTAT